MPRLKRSQWMEKFGPPAPRQMKLRSMVPPPDDPSRMPWPTEPVDEEDDVYREYKQMLMIEMEHCGPRAIIESLIAPSVLCRRGIFPERDAPFEHA